MTARFFPGACYLEKFVGSDHSRLKIQRESESRIIVIKLKAMELGVLYKYITKDLNTLNLWEIFPMNPFNHNHNNRVILYYDSNKE